MLQRRKNRRGGVGSLLLPFQWHSGQRKNFVHLQAIFYSKMPSSSRILYIKLCTTNVSTLAVTLAILRSQPELFARHSTCSDDVSHEKFCRANRRWYDHKANRTLTFLRRHLKIGSTLSKDLAYTSLVGHLLEYVDTVREPRRLNRGLKRPRDVLHVWTFAGTATLQGWSRC